MKDRSRIIRDQLGALRNPINMLKSIASQFPAASALPTMLDQLEGERTDERLKRFEVDAKHRRRIQTVAPSTEDKFDATTGWSQAVAEYLRRTVEVAIAYDGGFHSREQRGRELVLPFGHGCVVGEHEVMICREVIEFARDIAHRRAGRIYLLFGMAWYTFECEPKPDGASGLFVGRITRDEEKWAEAMQILKGLDEPLQTPARFTLTPYIGQEIGFVHAGEAPDAIRSAFEFSRLQFDAGVISHYRTPRDGSLKVFVSGVLAGGVKRVGSGVFGRDGTLFGVLSQVENYPSDYGRRAIVRTLLGHPKFTAEGLRKIRQLPYSR